MELSLIVLLLIMVFITSQHKNSNSDNFNAGQSFVGTTPPTHISNSRSNDYYMDRTGRKGILYNQMSEHKLYDAPPPNKRMINYGKTIKQLEIYPDTFYAKCVSKYNPDKVGYQNINNDPMNVYLTFDQGTLIRNKCYTTKSDC